MSSKSQICYAVIFIVGLFSIFIMYSSDVVRQRIAFVDIRAFINSKTSSLKTTEVATDAAWRVVEYRNIYVYSAHMDARKGEPLVVMVAAVKQKILNNNTLYCQLWIDQTLSAYVEAKSFNWKKLHERYHYNDMDIHCPFMMPLSSLPDTFAVSLTRKPDVLPNHLLRVTKPPKVVKFVRNFTVCLGSPIRLKRDPIQLMEWFENHILFGAEKFVVYHYKIHCPKMRAVFRHYEERGLLEMYKWNMTHPYHPGGIHHYHFQLFMIADCQYRNMYKTKYLLHTDLDEIMVPRGKGLKSWADVIRTSGCNESSSHYQFHHLHFERLPNVEDRSKCNYFNACSSCDCPSQLPCDNFIRSLCIPWRTDEFFGIRIRSKYIARPMLVRRMEIHECAQCEKMCVINIENGALHHYKGVQLLKPPANYTVHDTIMQQYSSRHVLPKVKAMCAQIARNKTLEYHKST